MKKANSALGGGSEVDEAELVRGFDDEKLKIYLALFFHPLVPCMDNLIIYQSMKTHHSKNLNPGNFFYANIDTNYTNKPDILVCGTHLRNEKSDQVPIGNITKMQADKILKQWGIR